MPVKFYEDEIYIRMCEKAKELQNGIYEHGDCIKSSQGKISFVGEYEEVKDIAFLGYIRLTTPDLENIVDDESCYQKPCCKIFRTDQLLEMVNLDGKIIDLCLDKERDLDWHKNGWAIGELGNDSIIYYDVHGYKTLEQCLLAYVMQKKFNKNFDSQKEEWV
jgi:hypothetical protein